MSRSVAPCEAVPLVKHVPDLRWIMHLGREYCDVSPPGAPFECALSRMAPGGASTRHAHDVAEIFVVLSGKATAHVDAECIPLEATESVYVPPGVIHHLSNPSDEETLVYLLICWKLTDPHTKTIPTKSS